MKTPYQRFWLLLKPDNREIYQVYTYAFFKGVIALSLPLGIQSIINLIQGGSSLFMVNSREMSYFNAQIKLNELMNKNKKAALEAEYAFGVLNTLY